MADDSQSFRKGPDGDVMDIEVLLDLDTNQKVIYWSDIEYHFPKARFVKKKNTHVAFVRNVLREGCEPRRIRHYPGVVLEVLEDDSSCSQATSVPTASSADTTRSSAASEDVTPYIMHHASDATKSFPFASIDPLPTVESLAILDTAISTPTFIATAVSSSIKESASVFSMPPSHRLLQRSQSMLQESSVQMARYEKSVQSGQFVQADAIMYGMQAMRKDMQEEFRVLHSEVAKNDELKALTQKIQDLESAAGAQTKRMEEMHKQSVELQERSLKMQQKALDRLALIQNKVAAILTQTYELHEYPIPRLFIVLPKEDTTRTEKVTRGIKNIFTKQFKLYFLCECGDHTKPADGRPQNPHLKHEIHLARHDGYDIDRPIEFFEKYGSYILTVLLMLKYGVTIAGVIVPPLSQLKIVDGLRDIVEDIDNVLKDIGPKVDSSIAYIEGLTGMQSQLSTSDPDATFTDSVILDGLEALEGADLRQLESFLKSSDEGRVLGNLYRVVTSEGHVKWVCLDHYRENYRVKAAQDLRDAVEEIKGKYNEATGSVEIQLGTPIAARKFYSALESSRFVQELDVTFDWSPTMQEFRDLRDAIKSTNIHHVRLQGNGLDVPLSDLFNNGRRSDPILQMMSGGKVQSLVLDGWEDFLDRIGTVPTTLHVRKLTVRLGEKWSKTAPRLVEILRASPLLTELTCWSVIDDPAPDHVMAALENSKLPQALKLELPRVRSPWHSLHTTRASVKFEAGTSRILSFDLQVESMEGTKLLRHPLVRNIYIKSEQKLSPLLEEFRKCLKFNAGLESVTIACSETNLPLACLRALQELFAIYPHQTPRLCLSNRRLTVTTNNIQDVNTVRLDLKNIDTPDIATGFLSDIQGNYTINAQTLNLKLDKTSTNINAFLRFLEVRPTQVQIQEMNISLNDGSDPDILPVLDDVLRSYCALWDTRVCLDLTNIGKNPFFAGSSTHQDSFWRILQDHSTRINISDKLPPPPSHSFSSSASVGPYHRLDYLRLAQLHDPTDQYFSCVLSMVGCISKVRGSNSVEENEDLVDSSCPTTTSSDNENAPNRLCKLQLFDCWLSHTQWHQLVQSVDVLTLNDLLIEDTEGFTDEHLAVLVNRCISTVARVRALEKPSELESGLLPSMSAANQLAVQDLRARTHQPFKIELLHSDVTDDFVAKEKARLEANSIEWVQFKILQNTLCSVEIGSISR
ncbi:hypothetical protein BGW39_008983 [Mortierella sp. 14UC]|nr:hypothetical protein BGW39_008983 [Mortierella sp. 14UC]